ncbi:hypothetical protein MHYP_G00307040 [Metynnis hypsauchen]
MYMNYSQDQRNGLYSAGSLQENVWFATFYTIVFILSVPCNALALWVFCKSKRCSSSKLFLLNLAVADSLYVLVLPMRVVYHASDNHWPLGEVSCRLVGFLFFLNLYCSMYFMTCISLDRLLAIVLPLQCQNLRKAANAKAACVIPWVLVTVSMAPVLFISQTVTIQLPERNVTVCHQLYLEKTSHKALVSTAVAIAIPLVLLTVSYILILHKLRTMVFNERTPVQQKAVRMIVLTMVNFLIAFVPYHIHRFLYIKRHTQGHISDAEIRSLAFGNRLTSALTCVNGVLDPVMYFFLARNYQNTLLQLCGRMSDKDSCQQSLCASSANASGLPCFKQPLATRGGVLLLGGLLNLYCSMYFMTCISLDRLLAIVLPLQCQNLRNAANAKVACVIPWVLVTVSMAPVLFTSQTVTIQSLEQNVTVCHQLYLEKTSHKALVCGGL